MYKKLGLLTLENLLKLVSPENQPIIYSVDLNEYLRVQSVDSNNNMICLLSTNQTSAFPFEEEKYYLCSIN